MQAMLFALSPLLFCLWCLGLYLSPLVVGFPVLVGVGLLLGAALS